ncbi:hypothetical protein ASAP_0661 [Asaia bogorensis]|uniref:Uncharacterized protein n=1 Tax=Asaia bogorensis TaxID=91915 RepID=A0A060QHL0_9PROT|nr:hypothetical protein ASAP_0661 [Asaia bogorensis]
MLLIARDRSQEIKPLLSEGEIIRFTAVKHEVFELGVPCRVGGDE